MTTRPSRRRGFTLLEVLTTVILTGLFMTLAGNVLVSAFRVERDSRNAKFAIEKFEHALTLLRRDIWASHAAVAQGQNLTLVLADGKSVSWVFSPGEESLERVEMTTEIRQRRAQLGCQGAFELHGPAVVLRLQGRIDQPADEIWLPSQIRIAQSGGLKP